jgi:AraC-like DNA-binding protein
MTDPIIDVPAACRERFVPLEVPALAAWRRAGVLRSGLGEVVPGYRIVRPTADRALVLVTVAGRGVGCDGAARVPLRPGTVWLVPPGRRQELSATSAWSIVWWYLDARCWCLPAEARLDPCPHASFVQACMRELCAETRAPRSKPCARRPDPAPPAEDRAWLLASLLLADLHRLVDPPPDAGADVRARIHADPGRAWSVATLAAALGVSGPTLQRRVRRLWGTTVHRLVVDERMALARQLLRHSELTQAAIAARVGYADPFAFARAFHRADGRWPSQLRSR